MAPHRNLASPRRFPLPRHAAPGALLTVVLLFAVVACSSDSSGLSVGDLRTVARRVSGGGAECPLSIPASDLRPATVAATFPVRADISNEFHAATGTLGDDVPGTPLATAKGVDLVCRYLSGRVRVTLHVIGLSEGQAFTQLLPSVQALARMSPGQLASFVAANSTLAAGNAAAVPGRAHAAVAVVAGDRSSVALLLSVAVANQDPKGPTKLPTSAQLVGPAADIARVIGS